jgi:hypothetical protein
MLEKDYKYFKHQHGASAIEKARIDNEVKKTEMAIKSRKK